MLQSITRHGCARTSSFFLIQLLSHSGLTALAILAALLSTAATANAAVLMWDRNTEPDLAGYKIYFRQPGESAFQFHLAVGITPGASGAMEYTLPAQFRPGQTYSFVVTAFDRNGNESLNSNETPPFTIPPAISDADGDGVPDSSDNCTSTSNSNQLDTDRDSLGDACDADDDNDGRTDSTDCAPLDAVRWRTGTFYDDADGDGVRTNSSLQSVCYGAQAPTGYTTSSNGPDNCPTVTNSSQVDSNANGIGDACENLDSDGDGIIDPAERNLGTDPQRADTDHDGLNDGQEALDGSDPLDRGSFLPVLGRTVCAEWNGYLENLWNVFEHVNLSSKHLTVRTVLYAITGEALGFRTFTIEPGAQFDLLVHDIEGWTHNSYGTVCSTHDGNPGDLDGRMVHYKEDSRRPGTMEFALAMSLSDGISGAQSVPVNTYQPSQDSSDAHHPVANWVQAVNRSSHVIRGTLTYFDAEGLALGSDRLALDPWSRRDLAAHRFGPSIVGIAQWSPDDPNETGAVQMRNVRYLYDNASGRNHFAAAFQLDGKVGSGRPLTMPLDRTRGSSIVELSNTLAQPITATLWIYSDAGALLYQTGVDLAAHATRHIITDGFLPAGSRGLAVAKSSVREGLLAVAMTYERTATGGIAAMYGVAGIEALGTVLRGSYNTYLAQAADLLLLNPGGSAVEATLFMVRADGTHLNRTHAQDVALGAPVSIPAQGLLRVSLKDFELSDVYGVVTVQPTKSNSLAVWSLRSRSGEYTMPTAVRQ